MTAETVTTRRPQGTACVNHWLVEPADGRTGEGRCKHCGATRNFSNSILDTHGVTHAG